jgi:pimeloyl-ACP methyl ester carboxylesterase
VSTLNVAGGELFYRRAGSAGSPVVFLHGGGCTSVDWEYQLRDLQDDHIAVACDLRGHGLSTTTDPDTCTLQQMATDVGHLIHSIGPEPAVLVGHSYGTRVALLAGQMHPQLVSGVVLVDGSRVWNTGDWSQIAASLAQWRDIGTRFGRVSDELLISALPAATQDRIRQTMKSTAQDVLWSITRSSAPWDAFGLPGVVRALGVPLLAIQSTYHDDNTPRFSLRPGQTTPYIELLAALKPDTEIVVLDGVGHYSMLEAPDQISQAVRRFAAGLPSRTN